MIALTGFDSWPQLALAAVIIAAAQLVYMTYGFGAGMIAVGLLALVAPSLQDAVVMLLLVSLPVELLVVRSVRRSVRWRPVLLIAAGLLCGIPLGAALLGLGHPAVLLMLLGGALIAIGALFVALPERYRIDWPPWSRPLAGALSGFLSGAFGIGGPPLVAYFQLQGLTKELIRGHLIAVFLLISLVRVPVYGFGGLITEQRLYASALLLPPALLGAWLGTRIHLGLAERTYRRSVGVVLCLLGAAMIAMESCR